MKRLIAAAAAPLLFAAALFAAGPAALTMDDVATQYRPYPDADLPALTPAPEGYAPFHMEHYGRHGSRWLITEDNYGVPVRELAKAERAGVLTPKGQQLLDELRTIQADSRGRLGELTPLGHDQHRRIARRMVENFPELFVDGAAIDTRSTVVIRCILSMLNEVAEIKAAAPGVVFASDASEADMHYMNRHDPVKNAAVDSAKALLLPPLRARHGNRGDYLKALVADSAFIADSLDRPALFAELFEVGLNMGSHEGRYRPFLFDVFSEEEIRDGWLMNNATWYLNAMVTPMTSYRAAEAQRELLRNMVASADTALLSPRPGANLRFGHETMVASLAALMGLDHWGDPIAGIDEVFPRWIGSQLFPMACNIQMVFYRPEGTVGREDDVLVKILLNEHEAAVAGATPVSGPYYRWTDLRPLFNNF